jgi:hypothetical protein
MRYVNSLSFLVLVITSPINLYYGVTLSGILSMIGYVVGSMGMLFVIGGIITDKGEPDESSSSV